MSLDLRGDKCNNCEFFCKSDEVSSVGICTQNPDRDELTFIGSSCQKFKGKTNACKYRHGFMGSLGREGVVVVYGDVKGNIYDCDTVVIINGDCFGNITNCDNVAGLLADKASRCFIGELI